MQQVMQTVKTLFTVTKRGRLIVYCFCCCFLQDNWTSLHWASQNGYSQVAELLISRNADVNIQTKVGHYMTGNVT